MTRKLTDETLMSTIAIFGPEKLVDEMLKAKATNEDLAKICVLQMTYSIAKVVTHKFQDEFAYQPASMKAETYLGACMAHLITNLFAPSVRLGEEGEGNEGQKEA